MYGEIVYSQLILEGRCKVWDELGGHLYRREQCSVSLKQPSKEHMQISVTESKGGAVDEWSKVLLSREKINKNLEIPDSHPVPCQS